MDGWTRPWWCRSKVNKPAGGDVGTLDFYQGLNMATGRVEEGINGVGHTIDPSILGSITLEDRGDTYTATAIKYLQ